MKTKQPVSIQRKRRRARQQDRRGTATVEFALVSAIVFALFFGAIEFTRFHTVRHSVDQAVYMGARTGIVLGATAADVDTAVRARLQQAGIIGATVTITPSVINNGTTSVTVRVAAPYDQNTWTIPRYFAGVDVVGEMTLDHENVVFSD